MKNNYCSATDRCLKVCHWNIEGLQSRIVGPKCDDDNFLKVVAGHDVIILTETHADSDTYIKIPGYYSFHIKRPKHINAKKHSGGIAIIVKDNLKDSVTFIKSATTSIGWLKLNKDVAEMNEDLFIGAVYFSPINSSFSERNDKDEWAILSQEMEKYQSKGKVLILGDFNARTCEGMDSISNDDSIHSPVEEGYRLDVGCKERNNMDKHKVCPVGRKLLDLCQSSSMRILNGRTVGDLLGAKTCFKWNGASTVDYALYEDRALHEVMYMKVQDFIGDLSDHCAISVCLKLRRKVLHNKDLGKDPKLGKIKWNAEIERVFKLRLNNGLKSIKIDENLGINELVNNVTDLLLNSLPIKPSRLKQKPKVRKQTKPWFTKDCRLMRQNVLKLGKAMSKDPNNPFIRKNYFYYAKEYKKLVKTTKREAKQSLLDKITQFEKQDPKLYWKLVNELRNFNEVNKKQGSLISPIQIWNHYNELLYKNGHDVLDKKIEEEIKSRSSEPFFSNLDYKFSLVEIRKALKKLKKGKAQGPDGIIAEMLISASPHLEKILVLMFNKIFSNAEFPDEWRTGNIINLHKGGSPFDINNYRGITLNPVLSKVFSILLNERLNQYIESNNILNDAQIGFRPKARTVDHIFVLRTIFDKYVKKDNCPVFACFVDFRKAYDSVWRRGLLVKLLRNNIRGKFYRMLEEMYKWSAAKCDLNNCLSESIQCNVGVKQGDVLSPTLFNLFVNDLPDELTGVRNSLDTPNLSNKPVHCLLYADDLVILSLSKKDLQEKLNQLYRYCKTWKLDINTSKTKIMIFNKKYLSSEPFHVGDTIIEQVRQYKYLGLIITDSFDLRTTVSNIRDRARKALFNLYKLNQQCEIMPRTLLNLFEKIIEPVLLYGCEIWGSSFSHPRNTNAENMWKNILRMPTECLNTSFCKRVLMVHSRTTNAAVMGELGRFPVFIKIIGQQIKFWNRMHKDDHKNILLEAAAEESGQLCKAVKGTWLGLLKEYSNTLAGNILDHNGCTVLRIGEFKDRIKENYQMYWLNQLNRQAGENGKMSLYRKIKNSFIFEPYLDIIQKADSRRCLAEIRLSAHNLEIERGRYSKTPREQRLCKFCAEQGTSIVEDELHFLLQCPLYKDKRDILLGTVTLETPRFTYLPIQSKLLYLLTAEGSICRAVGQFCNNPK